MLRLNVSSRRISRRAFRRSGGFSLLEILIALAILGLIVGLAVTKLGNVFNDAKVDTASLFVNTSLKIPLSTYQMRVGNFPSTAEGLQALLAPPPGKADRWGTKPYIDEMPLDPWKQPYQYAFPGKYNKDGYDLWSMGPDGQSGTPDDIGNWKTAPATEAK